MKRKKEKLKDFPDTLDHNHQPTGIVIKNVISFTSHQESSGSLNYLILVLIYEPILTDKVKIIEAQMFHK